VPYLYLDESGERPRLVRRNNVQKPEAVKKFRAGVLMERFGTFLMVEGFQAELESLASSGGPASPTTPTSAST